MASRDSVERTIPTPELLAPGPSVAEIAPVAADAPRDVLPPAAADPNGKGSVAAVLEPLFTADVEGAFASDVGGVTAPYEVVEPEVAMPAVSLVSGSTAGTASPAASTTAASTPAVSTTRNSTPPSKSRTFRQALQTDAVPRESMVNRIRNRLAAFRRRREASFDDHQTASRGERFTVTTAQGDQAFGDSIWTSARQRAMTASSAYNMSTPTWAVSRRGFPSSRRTAPHRGA